MTTPDQPLRMELTFELPGTPEELWEAIATANGVSAWFLPTDLEEREGGAVCFHMGDEESPGTVTGWEPHRRLEYSEPDWARLTGHDPATVTPLVTEFLIEARSGGTCALRVVSSAFGSGADWEQEFFEEMEQGWAPHFDNLRLYLARFAGRPVTSMSASGDVPGTVDRAWAALRDALGIEAVGQSVDVRGTPGQVERLNDPPPHELLVRLDGPVPGYLMFHGWEKGEDAGSSLMVTGYLFSDDAPAYVEREQPAWKAWLEALPVPAA